MKQHINYRYFTFRNGTLIQMNESITFERKTLNPIYSLHSDIPIYYMQGVDFLNEKHIYNFYILSFYLNKREILSFVRWMLTTSYQNEWRIFDEDMRFGLIASHKKIVDSLLDEWQAYRNNLELFG